MNAPILEPVIPTKKIRLDFLDALRGVAALYVVIFHMALVPTPQLVIPAWIKPWILNGGTGVTLFFIISAFTLCFTLDGRQHRPHSTYNFYVRRLFRIVPLYYLWLILMAVFYWGLAHTLAERKPMVLFATFTYNFFPPYQEGLVWASWTLGVEMLFYAVFPFIFKAVYTLRRSLAFLVFALLVACAHFAVVSHWSAQAVARGYITRLSIFYQLPIFALGMVVYFIYKDIRHRELPSALKLTVLLSGLALFFGLPYVWDSSFFVPIYYAMAIAYTLVFFGLSFYPNLFFINRYTVFLGVISYSLYLNHPRLVWFLTPLYHKIYALGLGLTGAFFLCFLVTFLPLLLVSYLTYRFIEQPTMALSNRFMKK